MRTLFLLFCKTTIAGRLLRQIRHDMAGLGYISLDENDSMLQN